MGRCCWDGRWWRCGLRDGLRPPRGEVELRRGPPGTAVGGGRCGVDALRQRSVDDADDDETGASSSSGTGASDVPDDIPSEGRGGTYEGARRWADGRPARETYR